MSAPAVLGVDVGGTGIKARLVAAAPGPGGPDGLDARPDVLTEYRVPTPHDDPDGHVLAGVVTELARTARAAARAAGMTLGAIGVVVPGIVDERAGRVVLAVNMGWRDVPLRAVLVDALAAAGITVPVAFGQDVRAGALAQARAGGAATLHGSMAFVAVGTGLASALVVDGLVLDADGWAGEIGQVVITGGPHSGLRVEEIASAGAVARRAAAPDARSVADRVRAGDPVATAVWDDCVAVLADAIAWITVVGGCARVVVGGGLAEAGDLLLGPLAVALAARLPGVRVPAIRPAQHGDAAGAVGAVALAGDALAAAARTPDARTADALAAEVPRDEIR